MKSATIHIFKRARFALATLILAIAAMAMYAGPAAATYLEPCTIELTPKTADNPLGAVHTVTATVTHHGYWDSELGAYPACNRQFTPTGALGAGPLPGWPVNFEIISGPNAGLKGSAVTDANGVATWQWVGNVAGTDVVKASLDHTYCEAWNDVPGLEPDLADCPAGWLWTETLADTATKNWIPNPPPPPVTPLVEPKVVISVSKKCVTRTFVVRSKNSGSYNVTKSTLYVDGKKIKSNKTGTFKITTGRYSSANHKFKVVTTFSNGAKITKSGKFKLCKSRLTSRKLDPRFTG